MSPREVSKRTDWEERDALARVALAGHVAAHHDSCSSKQYSQRSSDAVIPFEGVWQEGGSRSRLSLLPSSFDHRAPESYEVALDQS